MIEAWQSPLAAATTVGMILLCVAVGLCLVRMGRGPSLPDRVIGLDLLSILLVGLFLLYGIAESQNVALRVATVLALINFLGTVGFALYVWWRSGQ